MCSHMLYSNQTFNRIVAESSEIRVLLHGLNIYPIAWVRYPWFIGTMQHLNDPLCPGEGSGIASSLSVGEWKYCGSGEFEITADF